MLVVVLTFCFLLIPPPCDLTDNPGRQRFSFGFLRQIYNEDFSLYLFPGGNSTVRLSLASDSDVDSRTVGVHAGKFLDVNIPSRQQAEHNTGIQRKATHLTSATPLDVIVFAHNADYSDGFMAFPLTTGCACHYVAVSTLPYTYYPSSVVISAFENHTTLLITLPKHVQKITYNRLSYQGGSTISVDLEEYDTFHLESFIYDLTGVDIKTDKPVSVYSGSLCGYVPVDPRSSCSYLVEQIPPVSTWGTFFITVPIASREGGDIFRVVAAFNQTKIRFHNLTLNLDAEEYEDVDISSFVSGLVSSNKPILVTQFWNSLGTVPGFANPFMMLVPSTEHFESSYQIFTPPHPYYGYYNNFVNIVIVTGEENHILLNDTAIQTNWTNVSDTLFSSTSFPIAPGSWQFDHAHGTLFGLQVYGYIGPATYGYVAGWNMQKDTYSCQGSCLKHPTVDSSNKYEYFETDFSGIEGSGDTDIVMDEPRYTNSTSSKKRKSVGSKEPCVPVPCVPEASASFDLGSSHCETFKSLVVSLGIALSFSIVIIVVLLAFICRQYPKYVQMRKRKTNL